MICENVVGTEHKHSITQAHWWCSQISLIFVHTHTTFEFEWKNERDEDWEERIKHACTDFHWLQYKGIYGCYLHHKGLTKLWLYTSLIVITS